MGTSQIHRSWLGITVPPTSHTHTHTLTVLLVPAECDQFWAESYPTVVHDVAALLRSVTVGAFAGHNLFSKAVRLRDRHFVVGNVQPGGVQIL